MSFSFSFNQPPTSKIIKDSSLTLNYIESCVVGQLYNLVVLVEDIIYQNDDFGNLNSMILIIRDPTEKCKCEIPRSISKFYANVLECWKYYKIEKCLRLSKEEFYITFESKIHEMMNFECKQIVAEINPDDFKRPINRTIEPVTNYNDIQIFSSIDYLSVEGCIKTKSLFENGSFFFIITETGCPSSKCHEIKASVEESEFKFYNSLKEGAHIIINSFYPTSKTNIQITKDSDVIQLTQKSYERKVSSFLHYYALFDLDMKHKENTIVTKYQDHNIIYVIVQDN
ncbi:hypothetical protein TRFO_17439 [Tritrichomonas foetus]|uniref:Uncharacterized protein n=1 Tax=Tritrichomonas foetus TaxID=1144522 RepID=A0A1J4KN09_9EUKA|nr:hypothetical protein TRFO_17439 [Tritrichomonas foetus]|eukprot:OHT12711.1 hypothetical protein TRFO_17439 [Tritrichomonas foetus]